MLIAQDEAHVEQFTKQDERWLYADANNLDDVLRLPSIGCTLALSAVYKKVTFETDEGLHS